MSMFAMIPMLGVSLLVYTIASFAIAPVTDAGGNSIIWVYQKWFEIPLVSQDTWEVTFGHAFLLLSMVFLFIELLRATKTGTDSIVNHLLSMVLFIICLLVFILVGGYGNSIFFLFMSMTFLDFAAGFIVTTVTARRDFGVAA